MKSLLTLTAIALIVFGIAVLGYQGFTYTKHEEVRPNRLAPNYPPTEKKPSTSHPLPVALH